MASAVLFLGWNRPHVGKEDQAYAFLAGEATQYLQSVKDTYFERMDLIVLTPHMGTTNGAFILHGTRAKLDELRRTDEFEAFSMRMSRLLDGYGVVPGLNEEGVRGVMSRMAAKSG
ncbi:MAG: hypothetical protein HYV07_02400 [Deltaproteobacteria bacterium]|nr:hypothetical protein [Deltaproteobacteria bacterium]